MESKILDGESKLEGPNEDAKRRNDTEIELIASSSHPEKKCDLVFSVTSEGDGKTYSETLKFNVEAIDVKEENAEVEETESSDSSGLQSEFEFAYNFFTYVYIYGVNVCILPSRIVKILHFPGMILLHSS